MVKCYGILGPEAPEAAQWRVNPVKLVKLEKLEKPPGQAAWYARAAHVLEMPHPAVPYLPPWSLRHAVRHHLPGRSRC